MTFNAKGLEVTQEKGVVTIHKEGEIPKFVENVSSISFSAKRAIENGQKVLYVTERCVFRLTPKGLKLIEVYPGVDMQKDILDRLPFEWRSDRIELIKSTEQIFACSVTSFM